MPVIITLQCDGQNGACPTTFVRITHSLTGVQAEATKKRWTFRADGQIICPTCTPAPRQGCPRCLFISEFTDAMGHDLLGHKVTNLLASVGVTTWQQLSAMPIQDMHDIPQMGGTCMGRIRLRLMQHLES